MLAAFGCRLAAASGRPERVELGHDSLAELVARTGEREGGVGVEALQRARPRSAADAEIERRAAVAAVRARGQRAANHSLLVVGPCATCCEVRVLLRLARPPLHSSVG